MREGENNRSKIGNRKNNFHTILPAISTILLFTCCNIINSNKGANRNANYRWQKTDSALSLMENGEVLWQLNFNKKEDKPYFHPLRINGENITLERPADHPWHRGLWFSWKFINEVNYWEEDREKGYAEGRSRIEKVDIDCHNDFSVTVKINIEYAPEGKDKVLSEIRNFFISPPDTLGNYHIDWVMNFTAGDSEVVFDRTPPLKHGGEIWGGYGGLSFRAAENMRDHRYKASTGWEKEQDFTGEAEDAGWMDLSAVLNKNLKLKGGITIFDHPQNSRHPSPWYVWFEEEKHAFFTPAILFNEPIRLKPGERMHLKYRVYVHSGIVGSKKLNELFEDFQEKKI